MRAAAEDTFHESLLESASISRWMRQRVDASIDHGLDWAAAKSRSTLRSLAFVWGFVFLVMFLVLATLVFYWLVYWVVMPVMIHEVDLFFDFDLLKNGGPFGTSTSASACRDQPPLLDSAFQNQHQHLPSELPKAFVILAHADQQWTQWADHNKSGPPKHLEPRRPMPIGELYDIWIEFVLPDSEHNLELGPIMVETDLFYVHPKNASQRLLARSRRPLILPFTTSASKWVADILLVPIRMFGFFRPVQYISVRTIEKWSENGDIRRVPSAVSVTLSQPLVRVERAKLYFLVQLFGIRYCMYQYPILSYLTFVTLALSVQFSILFAIIFNRALGSARRLPTRFVTNSHRLHPSNDDDDDDGFADLSDDDLHDKEGLDDDREEKLGDDEEVEEKDDNPISED